MLTPRSPRGTPALLRFTCFLAAFAFHACGGGGGGGGLPDAPTGLVATVSSGTVRLVWNAVAGATSYNLYLASQPGVDASNWSTLPAGQRVIGVSSPHDQAGLTNDVTYYFVVTALDARGESAVSAQVSARILRIPSPPIGLAVGVQSGQLTLRWDPVAGASSYCMYRARESGVTAANYASLAGGERIDGVLSPLVLGGLTNEQEYFFVITAANALGESVESLEVAAAPRAAGWSWQVPYPTGNPLTSVDFVDASTGWIVGTAGTILHTSDGGSTWEMQRSCTSGSLSDVDFVDATTGWAVGGGGPFGSTHASILHTANGGLDWQLQASGKVPMLSGVDFVDVQNGWAVGDEGTILHTSDAGATWTPQASATGEPLWKVAFLDAENGYAVGGSGASGVVLKTTDGGASWSSTSILQAQVYDLSFPSVSRGWAIDATGRVFGTTNAGSSWGALPIPTSVTLGGIHFPDTSTGWVVGAFGTILRTTNGGGSWSQQASGTSEALRAVDSIGTQQAWVVGGNGLILHTSDGGATWEPQSDELWSSESTFTDAAFVDASEGWIVSRSIQHTTDGGTHWSVQLGSTADLLWGVDFADAQHGWAVGDGGQILHTSDGGLSWVPQDGNGATQLWDVDFLDASFGVAVGPVGVIRTTQDGGLTWVPRTSGTLAVLEGVCVVDAATAWAVGQGGVILKTTDGGQNWLGQISGTFSDLRAVDAVDANRAWAVGGNSADPPLLRTTDGGDTWLVQSFPTSPGSGLFWDVDFFDASHGWAVGSGGLICGTTDGGLHWQRQSSGASEDFWGACAVSPSIVWAIGEGLVKTNTGGW